MILNISQLTTNQTTQVQTNNINTTDCNLKTKQCSYPCVSVLSYKSFEETALHDQEDLKNKQGIIDTDQC